MKLPAQKRLGAGGWKSCCRRFFHYPSGASAGLGAGRERPAAPRPEQSLVHEPGDAVAADQALQRAALDGSAGILRSRGAPRTLPRFSSDHRVLSRSLSRRLPPLPPGIKVAAGQAQLLAQPGHRVATCELINQAKNLGGSCPFAKCAAASLKKSFSFRSSRFSLLSQLSSARLSLVSRSCSRDPAWPRSMRACPHPAGQAA